MVHVLEKGLVSEMISMKSGVRKKKMETAPKRKNVDEQENVEKQKVG